MENLVRPNHLKENASGRVDTIPLNLKTGILLLLRIEAAEMIIDVQQDVTLPSQS